MTDIEHQMLKLLDPDRPTKPGWLGATLWSDKHEYRPPPQAFARPAGKILNRLKQRGWSIWVRQPHDWGWIITSAGQRRLAQEQDHD